MKGAVVIKSNVRGFLSGTTPAYRSAAPLATQSVMSSKQTLRRTDPSRWEATIDTLRGWEATIDTLSGWEATIDTLSRWEATIDTSGWKATIDTSMAAFTSKLVCFPCTVSCGWRDQRVIALLHVGAQPAE